MTISSPKHFTGCEDALTAYDSLWTPGSSQRILNVEGISGNGKSTLLWYLDYHYPKPPARLHLRLDLATEILRAGDYTLLEVLANQLRRHLPPNALAAYSRRRDQALAKADTIRQTATHITIEQIAAHGGIIDSSPNSVTVEISRRLRDLRRQERSILTNELATAAASLGNRQVALFVDTYETVRQVEDAEFRSWLEEEVLPMMLESLPNMRVVLAGREDLPFRADHHHRIILRPWTRDESDHFLASYRLTDNSLAEAIFGHCAGHPFLTNLARELWQAGQDSGRHLTIDELKHGIDYEAAARWLFDRLLERLSKLHSDAFRAAALLRELSLDAINAVMDESQLTYKDYQHLLHFSFIQLQHRGAPRIHDLIRQTEEAWNRIHEPERHRRLHGQALRYYVGLGEQGFIDTLYHHMALEPEAAFEIWNRQLYQRICAFDRIEQQALLELMQLPERWATLSVSQRGRWHWQLGQSKYFNHSWPAALADYDEAHELFHKANDRLGEANVLQTQGDVFYILKDSTAALTKYDEALVLYRTIGDRLGEANVLHGQANVLAFLNKQFEALSTYDKALSLFRSLGARHGEANVLRSQGKVLAFSNQSDTALIKYDEAIVLYRTIGDRLGEANVLFAQGELLYSTQQIAKAMATYDKALELFHLLGDRVGEANVLRGKGEAHLFLRQTTEAVISYDKALNLARSVGDYLGEATALASQGILLMSQAQFVEALTKYDEALKLFHRLDDRLGEANVLHLQGDTLVQLKKRAEAEAKYDHALDLHRAIANLLGVANVLAALSRFWLDYDMKRASAYLHQAADIRQQMGGTYSLGADYGNFGMALLHRKQFAEALTYLRKAKSLFAQLKLVHLAEEMQQAIDMCTQYPSRKWLH